jgi:hypothetical protein
VSAYYLQGWPRRRALCSLRRCGSRRLRKCTQPPSHHLCSLACGDSSDQLLAHCHCPTLPGSLRWPCSKRFDNAAACCALGCAPRRMCTALGLARALGAAAAWSLTGLVYVCGRCSRLGRAALAGQRGARAWARRKRQLETFTGRSDVTEVAQKLEAAVFKVSNGQIVRARPPHAPRHTRAIRRRPAAARAPPALRPAPARPRRRCPGPRARRATT